MPDINQNWLDRTIAYVAPGMYAKRMAWRKFNASFRGSVASRLDRPWSANNGITTQSPTERLALTNMRDRAREVDRLNPIGHGMLNRLVDNVIGDGMSLQARTVLPDGNPNHDFNKEVEDRWARWWGDSPESRGLLTGAEVERITYREIERDGDVGWILADQGGRSRIQVIRADQIQTPADKKYQDPKTRGQIFDGVECNAAGRPIAFHLVEGNEFGNRKWTRIDADNFVYLPRLKRANQVRGETCFAQVFGLLDQIDGYIDATIIAARMAAVFGLIFKESNAGSSMLRLPNTTNSQGVQQKAVTLENGSVKFIGAGDEVVQVQASQPMQQTPDFIRAMLRLIGLPMDMPLELVLFDFSQVNFSSARASLLQFYRAMRPRQKWFATKAMSRVYRWWLSREVAKGGFSADVPPDYWSHEFVPRGWQWVDPVKELQAAMLAIDAGLDSRQRIAKSLGHDADEIRAEQVADMQARKLAGLPELRSSLTRDPDSVAAEEEPDGNESDNDA